MMSRSSLCVHQYSENSHVCNVLCFLHSKYEENLHIEKISLPRYPITKNTKKANFLENTGLNFYVIPNLVKKPASNDTVSHSRPPVATSVSKLSCVVSNKAFYSAW